MSAPVQLPAFSIGSVDAQRIVDALSLMEPKWTAWSAMTLAQEDRPTRVRDVAVRLPFVSEQFVGKRLATMHADGSVTRDDDRRGAPYRLSMLGESLAPVHRFVPGWSHAYLSLGRMAEAERVEDALRRLRLRHTTAVIRSSTRAARCGSSTSPRRPVWTPASLGIGSSGFRPTAWSTARVRATAPPTC